MGRDRRRAALTAPPKYLCNLLEKVVDDFGIGFESLSISSGVTVKRLEEIYRNENMDQFSRSEARLLNALCQIVQRRTFEREDDIILENIQALKEVFKISPSTIAKASGLKEEILAQYIDDATMVSISDRFQISIAVMHLMYSLTLSSRTFIKE